MSAKARRPLYVDTAFTVEIVRQQQHQQFFELRHIGSYFVYIWGLHQVYDRLLERTAQ